MRLRILAGALCLVAFTLVATADVVLHPGYVTGSVGLSGWSFDGGSVSVYSNTTGYAGSSSFTGASSYSVTVEGGQTFDSVNENLYSNSSSTSFSLSVSSPFTVGIGDTVIQNMYAAGASVQASVTATGATMNYFYATAYGSQGSNTFFSGTSYGYNGAGATMPVAATTSDIHVYINVYLTVNDANGNSCPEYRYYTTTIPGGVSAGGSASVSTAFDLTGEVCPSGAGSATGTINLNGLPSGTTFNGTFYMIGPDFQYQSYTSHPFTYLLNNLKVGSYYTYAYETFAAPFSSSLALPNNGEYFTTITDGTTTTRDFIFDAGTVSGTMTLNGPIANAPSPYDNRYFFFAPDYTQAWPPPNYGGSSSVPLGSGASNPYGAVLTTGRWTSGFGGNIYLLNPDNSIHEYQGFSTYGVSKVDIASAGASVSVDQSLDTSEADLVFDVIVPSGQSPVLISNPNAYLSSYDAATGRSANINAYSYEQNAATPTLHVIGAPGHYTFDAYATVRNSYTKFVSSSINIGTPSNTPVGTNVDVPLLDAFGNGLNVDVTYSQVTKAGDTSGSTTNVGPAPPGSFQILQPFGGAKYLSINTTATFTPPVKIAIQYNPADLGLLAPGQEKNLQLWHYNCSTTPCAWEMINDPPPPDPTNPDVVNHIIYGKTNSFSVFALMLPQQSAHPPNVACVGTQANPVVIATAPGMCAQTVTSTNGLAGSCSDGGGGVASCNLNGSSSLSLVPGDYSILVEGTSNDGATASCTSYVRVADMERPSISCPAPMTVECTGPTTPVALTASAGDNCGVASSSCSPSAFGLGGTPASCVASDAAGNASSCSTSVTVVDTTAPSLTLSASPTVLWPPNHALVPINLSYSASDVCDPHPAVSCTASSNQPASGGGSGNTNPDVVWSNGKLFLRAERAGTLGDRVYTVSCTATDASGNTRTATTTVTVPHDQSK
jgi:hypothetical protein